MSRRGTEVEGVQEQQDGGAGPGLRPGVGGTGVRGPVGSTSQRLRFPDENPRELLWLTASEEGRAVWPLPPETTPRLRASAELSRTRRRRPRREVRDQASATMPQAPPRLFGPEKVPFGQRVLRL